MKKPSSLISFLVVLVMAYGSTLPLYGETIAPLLRYMGVGARGEDVLRLQKVLNSDPDTRVASTGVGSPGFETDYFGALTRNAVNRFQKKYTSSVLNPGQAPTGYVGPKTLRTLNVIIEKNLTFVTRTIYEEEKTPPASLPYVTSPLPQTKSLLPTVVSVSPERVRRGDTVTISGKNFAKTNNTVVLSDGPVSRRFYNVKSSDGATLSFVFDPPIINTMSESEIRALPKDIVEQIEKPLLDEGLTLADALTPYKNFSNESELTMSLEKNGHSFDELYNYFFVGVETSSGKTLSSEPLLYGLRSLPISGLVKKESDGISTPFPLAHTFEKFISWLLPTAYAQGQWEGGINTGIIMICTCGDGYLTFMTDYNKKGTGLYWFSWGFQADSGAGFIPPNQLGGYQQGGQCSIYAGTSCFTINANQPKKPWGTNLI
ncbi:MAG: peptidoglycan-binding protein [Candidatus Taylorbacteria bacterium]|nr:peptidoglycan-binding protein [Candidatus Taylorbacteria bacterium]